MISCLLKKSGISAHLLFQPGPKGMLDGFFKPESSLVSCTCLKCMHSAAPNLCIIEVYKNSHGNIPYIYHSHHFAKHQEHHTYFALMRDEGGQLSQKDSR